MTTGIFAYDGFIDPSKYDGYKIFIANPLMPVDLAQQLNAGVVSLMDSGCDNIVFLGNGCTPQDATIQSHVEQLERHLYPLITCGRILHSDTHWKDYREVGAAKRLSLFNVKGTIVQNSSVLTNGYGVSVGNFAMNRAAIDRMNRFTQLYFDCPGPLPRLENSRPFGYGKVLSLCAWCARVTIFMLPTGCNNAVMYNSRGCNPYASNSCDGDDSGDALRRINEEMAKQPLGLDFFDSARD